MDSELKVYFPDMFGEANTFDLYYRLITRARLQLGEIINEQDNSDKIREINEWLLEQQMPVSFDMEERSSFLVQSKKSFAKVCAALRDNSVQHPEQLTAMQFYSQIQHIKDKARSNEQPTDQPKQMARRS